MVLLPFFNPQQDQDTSLHIEAKLRHLDIAVDSWLCSKSGEKVRVAVCLYAAYSPMEGLMA